MVKINDIRWLQAFSDLYELCERTQNYEYDTQMFDDCDASSRLF